MGSNAVSRQLREFIGLLRATWENPLPAQELCRLEFRSSRHGPRWFVVAITVD